MSDAAREALDEARRRLGDGDYAEALAACARARAAGGSAELRAVEVWLRACADVEGTPDVDELAGAAETLAGNADWEDAMGAFALLGRSALRRGEFAEGRRHLSRAIGCGQAGGSQIALPSLQRRLGELELKAGHPDRALAHLSLAMERLKGVVSLNARLVEAECLDLLGDAWAASREAGKAKACWEEAIRRQMLLERVHAADEIRRKL